MAQSIISLENESYFVVGTAYVLPSEDEPSAGRLLLFKLLDNRRLMLLSEHSVKGCVYSMSLYEKDKIIAGINSFV